MIENPLPVYARHMALAGVAAFRWAAVAYLFLLLIAFGLFYSLRRQLDRLRAAREAMGRRFSDEEFREEVRVTCEYVFLMAVVPLFAAGAVTVRAVHRCLTRLGGRAKASG